MKGIEADFFLKLRDLMLEYEVESITALCKRARIYIADGQMIITDFEIKSRDS